MLSQSVVLENDLDPASRRELAEILTGLDVTVLMVTHDLPYAFEL
jgi:cobalt/nickel transport system ATP-binding protein